jgi:DNA-binding MarR family transcriptional regulator
VFLNTRAARPEDLVTDERAHDEHAHEVREVMRAVAELQIATDAYDAAAAVRLGVNRTDLALLSLLDSRGPLSPGELALGLRLTPASTTVAIQRLTRAGYVTRVPDATDRRRATIELTDAALAITREDYGPIGEQGARQLGDYSAAERAIILDFLARSRRLLEEHGERISADGPPSS